MYYTRYWPQLLLVVLLFSCNKKSEKQDTTPPPSPIEIYTQISDPRLFDVTVDSANKVVFAGERDPEGKPVRITSVTIGGKNDSINTNILLDEQHRISTIYANTGAFLNISYLSETTCGVRIVLADGTQFNTDVDLAGGRKLQLGGKGTAPRNGIGLRQVNRKLPVQESAKEVDLKPFTINVSKCGGIPADVPAINVIMYKKGTGVRLASVMAKKSGTGIYTAALPTPKTNDIILETRDICKTVLELKDIIKNRGLNADAALLVIKSLQVSANENPDPTYYEFLKRLEASIKKAKAGEGMMAVLKDEATTTGCSLIPNDELYNFGGVTLFVQALGNNGSTLKTINGGRATLLIDADAQGSFPVANLSLGDNAGISTVTLNPESPNTKQGYYASASLDCVGIGDEVTISVLGTDGYEDGYSHVITLNDQLAGYVLELYVPGASVAGIKDVVTVTLTKNGETITKSAYLTFK